MAVARDAVTESATFTADTTFTHTPVGTPKGVLVYIAQNGSATDQVDSVTYGGVALTRVQLAVDATTEPMASYAYFVGSGIPTGAQTVAINETGGTTKLAFVITLTASADTAVEASGVAQDNQANPSVTLATGAGVNTYVSGLLMSGLGTVGGITAGANGTTRGSNDFGQQVCYLADRDTNGTGGNVVFDLVAATDDVALVATAIKEVSGSGPQNVSVTGRGTAASFGSVSPAPGAVSVAVSGRGSAAQLGAVSIRTAVLVGVTGKGSAASFGSTSALPGNVGVPVTGRGSVAAYGTLSMDIAFAVPGKGSAAAFGTVGASTSGGAQNVGVSGRGSAAAFGSLIAAPGTVRVSVAGKGSAAAFSAALRVNQRFAIAGRGSAAAFGSIATATGGVNVHIAGLGSAAAFGSVTIDGGAAPTFSPAIHGGRFYR